MADEPAESVKPNLRLVPAIPPPLTDEAGVIAQGEMPFAIVEGEPVTQLPRDLYIPPHALEVFLEAFEGPLDLLLYLIRRQNIDILDIPIAEISKQYVQYIELMKQMQFELAGEYLVMAATLAEIKSRMLLPRSGDSEDDEEEDPRAELIRRLQEYERFKQAAEDLDSLDRIERDVIAAGHHAQRAADRLQGRASALEHVRAPSRAAGAAECARADVADPRHARKRALHRVRQAF